MITRIIIAILLIVDFYYFLKQYKSGKELYKVNSVFYTILFKNPIFSDVFKRFIKFASVDEFSYVPYVAVAFMYAITILSFIIVDCTLPFVYIGIYIFIMSFFKLVLYVEDKRNGVK